MYKNRDTGFTLVELIVVIVVLGILAAIGIPRYNNYVNESRLAHIKADMKTISGFIEVVAMDDDGIYRGDPTDDTELKKAITEGKAYKEGNPLLSETDIGGSLHLIKDPFIRSNARSKLKGTFLVDNNDEVYYIADKKLKGKNPSTPEQDSGSNSSKWRFTNVEPGIIDDYLLTATNGVDEKYLIFDGFSLESELNQYRPNQSSLIYYDGWKELNMSDNTGIDQISKIRKEWALSNGEVYNYELNSYVNFPNNVKIRDFYINEPLGINVFEDTDGNLYYGAVHSEAFQIMLAIKKDKYKEHLGGMFFLGDNGKLFEISFDKWNDEFPFDEIDNNVSRIIGGLKDFEDLLYEKEGKIYAYNDYYNFVISNDPEVDFIKTQFSDVFINENNNAYIQEDGVEWLKNTKEIIPVDIDEYITFTNNKIYRSIYNEEGNVSHEEIIGINYSDIIDVINEAGRNSIIYKDGSKTIRVLIPEGNDIDLPLKEDVSGIYSIKGRGIDEETLMDKKPILYSKNIYKIDDTLHFVSIDETTTKHEGYDVIASVYSGVYLKDSNDVIYYLDNWGKISEVEEVDAETRNIAKEMNQIQSSAGNYVLANKKLYKINFNDEHYLKLEEISNTTGHNISEIVISSFAKLENGELMDIYDGKLVPLTDERDREILENIMSDEQMISALSKEGGIEENLEPYFDMIYSLKQFPKEVNASTVKVIQVSSGEKLIAIIDNGKVWITGYRILLAT